MVIAHPLWMNLLGILLPVPLALLAARLAAPRPSTSCQSLPAAPCFAHCNIRLQKEHKAMARTILGIFLGATVASLTLIGCWYASAQLYPLPTSVDFATPESLSAYAAATPSTAIACILGGWALAGLLGGWTSAKITRPHRGMAVLLIGAALTITVIFYATLMPNPEWVTVVGVLLPMPFAVAAGLLAVPRSES